MSKIKRSLWKSFINTTPLAAATWVQINTGVTAAKISYNGKTTKETYIHENTASFSVDSYAPKMPFEMSPVNAEALFEFLDTARKARSVLSDAETELLNVYLYKGNAGSDGIYLAEKWDCSIPLDKFAREGGKPVKLGLSINCIGSPERGLFNATDVAFTASNTTALLESLEIGGSIIAPVPLVMSPAFKNIRIWYTMDTVSATDVINLVAEVAACTFDIDVDGTPVLNGALITWVAGLNIVNIQVTNVAVTADYVVLVTYTPA